MNGCVQLLDSYCDDSRMEVLVYSREEIEKRLAQVAAGEFGHYRGIDTPGFTKHSRDIQFRVYMSPSWGPLIRGLDPGMNVFASMMILPTTALFLILHFALVHPMP